MANEVYDMSWNEVSDGARNIILKIKEKNLKIDTLVPILRGGAPLGNILSSNMKETDIAYIHIRRSVSDEINANLGTPVLKGVTNCEKITGKSILIVDDMLDKGVTMEFAIKELEKLKPASIHIAVLYDFSKLENKDSIITGLYMAEKKWILFPWEKEI